MAAQPKCGNRNLSPVMKMIRFSRSLASLSLASLLMAGTAAPLLAQTASQDMQNAGTDTKDAAKSTAHATKRTTKKAYHKSKKGTAKVADKTKEGTTVAADKTKETSVKAYDKTKEGVEHVFKPSAVKGSEAKDNARQAKMDMKDKSSETKQKVQDGSTPQ
jgi:hypothetical protein